MTDLICVDCGSKSVHRSRRRSWLDCAVRMLGGRTCRCHTCNARFAGFGRNLVRIASVHRAAKGLAMAFMMMTAAALVIAGIVWLNHTRATASPASCVRAAWSA
jgi:hypothetical protein